MPFDLFFSAHRRDVDRLLRAGAVESPQRLATNRLVLTCRRSARCDQLTWGALPGVQRLGVGLKGSPIGEYTEALLKRAAQKFGADWLRAVQAQTVTQEPNVRRLRAQVALGGLDAAIVYASDVATDDRFRAVRPPEALDRPTELWLAVRAGAATAGSAAGACGSGWSAKGRQAAPRAARSCACLQKEESVAKG